MECPKCGHEMKLKEMCANILPFFTAVPGALGGLGLGAIGGAAVGRALGKVMDKHILKKYKCPKCGYEND